MLQSLASFSEFLLLVQADLPVPAVTENIWWTSVFVRILHILAASIMLGGSIYLYVVQIPKLNVLSPQDEEALWDVTRDRWIRLIIASIGALMATGFYSFIAATRLYEISNLKLYHILFGSKVLLALAFFFIASILTGRSRLAQRFQRNLKFWYGVNVLIGITILVLAAFLAKVARKERMMYPLISPDTETPYEENWENEE